ncbi:GNAT family N-acetyltransferase [Peijinzhouia sedimentorum]
MKNNNIIVRIANEQDINFAQTIADEMASSAAARGTGIARRTPEYIQQKMLEGKAIIAHTKDGQWVGFCYIEAWSHGKYVANSGLIVSPEFRGTGVARSIKEKIFELSLKKYPESKIFGLTTGLAVMKINSELGYEPVTYSELTDDEAFWKGCQSCVNFDILQAKQRKNCICTGMLYDPAWKNKKKKVTKWERHFKDNFKLFERWTRLKKWVFLRDRKPKAEEAGGKSTSNNILKAIWSLFF